MTAAALPTIAACLAVLALALPAAAAGAQPGLAATSVAAAGVVGAQGTLGALSIYDGVSNGLVAAPGLPPFGFQLDAAHIDARTYVTDPTVHGGVGVESLAPTVEDHSFTQASVRGTAVRGSYWVSVFPLAGHAAPAWEESSSCAGASPSSATSVQAGVNAGAPAVTANVEGTVAWDVGCDAQAVRHVRGDFLVTLWQWDATAESAEGPQALPSGQEPLTPGGPMAGYPQVAVSRDRQVFLTVTGGDFLLPSFHDGQAYLFEPTLHAVGRVTLRGASGFLAAQGQEVHADEVSLAGDLTVTMARGGDASTLALQVQGVLAGGPAAAVPPTGWPAWLWLATVPAFVAAPLVPAIWRARLRPRLATEQGRARALTLYGHAETFAFEGDFGKARRLLDRAIALEGMKPDFFALRARCRAALGDAEGALRDHAQAHEAFPATDPDARASNAYEAARTCGGAGRRESALSWLRLAAQYDPHCMRDAAEDPILLALFTPVPGRPRPSRR